MDYYFFLPLTAFFANILLGLYILYKDYKNILNKIYSLFAFSLALWALGDVITFTSFLSGSNLSWISFGLFGSSLAPAFLLHFALLYTKRKFIKRKIFLIFLYLPALLFIIIGQTTDLISGDLKSVYWGYTTSPDILFMPFAIYIFVFISLALYFTYKYYINVKTKKEKKQLILINVGISIPVIGGIITEVISPILGFNIIPLSTTLTTITAILIALAIIKFEFLTPMAFSIRRKSLVILFIITILIATSGFSQVIISREILKESIGEDSVLLAEQTLDKIDRNIYHRIEQTRTYSLNLAVEPELLESNKNFDAMQDPQAYINEKDKKWTETNESEITPFIYYIINSNLSQKIRNEFELKDFYNSTYGYNIFSEIFLTNKYGAIVSATQKTTDYYQADEDWWQKANETGLYTEDLNYDESAGVYSTDICLRIDDENGGFSGVLKVVLNNQEIVDILEQIKKGKEASTLELELITDNGKIIYSTEKNFSIFQDIPTRILARFHGEEHRKYFISEGDEPGEGAELFAHAHSKGYRDYEGQGWVLIVEYETEEIFAPLTLSHNILVIFTFVIAIIFIVLIFLISRSIIDSVIKLRNAAKKIEKGNLDAEINIKSRDELGELSKSFRNMVKNLKKSRKEIQDYSKNLENKVEERTKELNQKVEELEKSRIATLNMMEDLQETIDVLQKTKKEMKIKNNAIESSISGVIISDKKGKITYANKSFLNMWNYKDLDDIIDKPLGAVLQLVGNSSEIFNSIFQEEGWVGRAKAKTDDGKSFPIQITSNLVKNEKGEIINLMASCIDISEQVKAEKDLERYHMKLEQQNIKLKKLDQIKSNFLNVTSHELRTPMSAIKGYIQMIQKQTLGDVTKEQKNALNVVLRNTDRLDHLIQDILDISRLESGAMKFVTEETDINKLINDVSETMQSSAENKNIEINTEISDKLPDLFIDQERIKQVIINLVNNAIKFSPDGSIINIRAKKDEENILFEVQDFGKGIPQGKEKKIFKPFYQVDSGMDRKFGGAGLGLAISRGVVVAHGGDIWVESKEGKGSTFKFTLPVTSIKNVEERFKEIDLFSIDKLEDEVIEEKNLKSHKLYIKEERKK